MKNLELLTGSVEREGEEIYWELIRDAEEGQSDNRPVVVLSHGAGGSHAVWYQQVPQIGERYRVVTWDSRGFGNSTNNTGQLAPQSAANDLAAILDELEISEAHLVGQSMGGWHVSAFATPLGTESNLLPMPTQWEAFGPTIFVGHITNFAQRAGYKELANYH